jgi:hypothetical protein
MLKITTQKADRVTILKLEGQLAGPWVDVLDRYWHIAVDPNGGDFLVNLEGVTFIDRGGKALLARMHEQGAAFHAVGCLTTCIVDEITKGAGNGPSRAGDRDKRHRN